MKVRLAQRVFEGSKSNQRTKPGRFKQSTVARPASRDDAFLTSANSIVSDTSRGVSTLGTYDDSIPQSQEVQLREKETRYISDPH